MNGVLLKGTDHLQTGTVAHMGEARVAVPAKVALKNTPVFGPIKKRPPLFKFQNPVRRLLGVELGHAPVVEHLAATHGIPEMDLPVVLLVDVAQGCGDPALGHDRMRLPEQRFTDKSGFDTGRRGFDGRAESRATRANHDHVVFVSLVLIVCHLRRTSRLKYIPLR